MELAQTPPLLIASVMPRYLLTANNTRTIYNADKKNI
jgi:hypothetical protein